MNPSTTEKCAIVEKFKERYARDFIFGTGNDTVTDGDIKNAMRDAAATFNAKLFSVKDGRLAFLLCAAHYVVFNIQAAGGLSAKPQGLGVENQAQGPIISKGAAGVSASYVEPPDRIKSSTILMQFWLTDYGRKYLAMLQPKLAGNVHIVHGPIDAGASGSPSAPFSDLGGWNPFTDQ